MNTTSSSLVWATPVSYKSLIANLSAYKSEKTNLDAFIYCNNTNPENTHLPQEIVDAITARVLAPGFKENFDLWTKLETCAEKRCGRDDHVSPQQRVKMAWKRMYTFYSDNGMTPPPKRKLARQIDAEIEIMHECNEFGYSKICRQRRREWRDMVGGGWELSRLQNFMEKEFGLEIHIQVQYLPDVMRPLFFCGHVPVQAYLVLKPRPGNKETHMVPSKVGDKRRFDDDDTSESRKAKHTKIEDTAVSEGNRKQEDIPESQEFTIPAKPSESTLSEPDSQLFGHAMRILELTPKLHDCHILIHDPTIVDEIKGWTKNERVPKLQDRLEKLRGPVREF
ncbi:putative lysophospholipase [Venturia inaequalis]|nr:putative lysophospholipase [Venturia inaequalis]